MLREVEIRNSSPPLSKPHPPQNSEVQPFPLPVLPCPDIPVGGRLAHFVEQWEELTDNKWVLSIVQNGFKIPFKLDAPSDWRPGGRGFNPRRGRQHSFVEIDHEIVSTVILSLPLIQEGQLSVSGERMCTILVNRLED